MASRVFAEKANVCATSGRLPSEFAKFQFSNIGQISRKTLEVLCCFIKSTNRDVGLGSSRKLSIRCSDLEFEHIHIVPQVLQLEADAHDFLSLQHFDSRTAYYSASLLSSASAASARPGSSTSAASSRLRGTDFAVLIPSRLSISTWRIRLPGPIVSLLFASW